MRKILNILWMLWITLLIVGCQTATHYPKKANKCNGCTDLAYPKDYIQNVTYTDHEGEIRNIPLLVSYSKDVIYTIYHVVGTNDNDKVSHYYSLSMPTKQEGLLYVQNAVGSDYYLDFTSIEIKKEPLTLQPLDEENQKIKDYHSNYAKMRNECPEHSWQRNRW